MLQAPNGENEQDINWQHMYQNVLEEKKRELEAVENATVTNKTLAMVLKHIQKTPEEEGGMLQLASAINGRQDERELKKLQYRASTLKRAEFARKCEKLHIQDNYIACWNAMSKKCEDIPDVVRNSSNDFTSTGKIDKESWRVIARTLAIRGRNRGPSAAIKEANQLLKQGFAGAKNVTEYYGKAHKHWHNVEYIHELEKKSINEDAIDDYIEAFVQGLPDGLKRGVLVEMHKTRQQDEGFSLEQARELAETYEKLFSEGSSQNS